MDKYILVYPCHNDMQMLKTCFQRYSLTWKNDHYKL